MKFKFISITCIFILALWLNLLYKENQTLIQNKKQYQANQNKLINQLKRIYEDNEKLNFIKQELTTKAKTDKPIFNWYQDISHTSVIKRLQQQN